MYFIQPGLQEVIIGNVPPCVNLWINSFASSIIVKSAPVFVSNTLLNPNFLSDVTIFPVTFVPIFIPNSSPSAALTAGAVCTTTNVSSSFSFSHTKSVLSFSRSAPTGHAVIHCPQNVQLTSFKLWSPTVDTQELNPLFTQSIAPIF